MRIKPLCIAALLALLGAYILSDAGARLPPPDPEPVGWRPTPAQLRTALATERYYESSGRALARRAGELYCLRYRCLSI
jgi:hypothetical protein